MIFNWTRRTHILKNDCELWVVMFSVSVGVGSLCEMYIINVCVQKPGEAQLIIQRGEEKE